ncbi:uncharacterized protein LOC107628140 isoform X2 [Arachis ipaensis]|uniref:uncharacterized protein LOC107628140 isoform X2 n=1 Tax=Arachis ipaensis TaxID=130454 RepID=UPI000A2B736A|nr:uncharacterized protein LOC107628140 isoform X2 [Arachis ipaensis]XP_029146359.1 uncharacterized protein LOC112726579 isoform X2 [Arachis hypogaea]
MRERGRRGVAVAIVLLGSPSSRLGGCCAAVHHCPVTVEALRRRSDRQKPPVEPLSSWAELWFLHAEFSSRACDIKLPRRQRSRRRSVFSDTRRFSLFFLGYGRRSSEDLS